MNTSSFHGIEYYILADQAPPIQLLKSSIIAMIITAGKGPVNQPVAIYGSERRAVETFGEYHNDGFTGPQAFKHIYLQGGVTCIAINVCDPELHNTDVVDELVTLNKTTGIGYTTKPYHRESSLDSQITVVARFGADNTVKFKNATGVELDSLKSLDGNTTYAQDLTESLVDGVLTITRIGGGAVPANTDLRFTLSKAGGWVLGTDFSYNSERGSYRRLAGGGIPAGATIKVDYNYVDPTKVTENDVLGAVTSEGRTGAELLLAVEADIKIKPRILIAPHFTNTIDDASEPNNVLVALNEASKKLGARVWGDCPNLTLQDAIDFAAFFQSPEDRVSVHYPNLRTQNPDAPGSVSVPASALIAGHMARVDIEEGFWNSPSNRSINGVLKVDKPLTWALNDPETEVQALNTAGVTTTIYHQGFRLWGNRQCNGVFLSTARTADMVAESIAMANIWAVDRNISSGLVEQIVEAVKSFLRRLETDGALVPNPNPSKNSDAWADPDLNSPDQIAEGHLRISYRLNPPTPAERITFIAHVTREYTVGIFQPQ